MTKLQLLKKIAVLESVNDQLITEVTHIDHLLRLVGFTNGLETAKLTAEAIVSKGLQDDF